MTASESRQRAREALAGKWGKVALTILVYALLTSIISWVLAFIPIVGSIAQFLINIPLSFGLIATLMKIKKGDDTTYTEFFNNGFSNFAQSWKVTLWTWVKLILPIILMIVSLIIIFVGISIGIADTPFADKMTTSSNIDTNEVVNYFNTHEPSSACVITILVGYIAFMFSSLWLTIKQYLFKPTFFILFDNPDMNAKDIVEQSASMMKGNRWKFFCLELSFIGWAILACFTCGIGMLWLLPYLFIAEVCFYDQLKEKNN